MITVKVLGPGCVRCDQLAAVAKEAALFLGVEATVTKLTDRRLFDKYQLMATPGLVINGKLVSAGRVPDVSEVTGWLADVSV